MVALYDPEIDICKDYYKGCNEDFRTIKRNRKFNIPAAAYSWLW
jgi:hypothetical protein